MKLHEYQAKQLFESVGIPVPRGVVARTADDAARAYETLRGPCLVKAQLHAGGRGKAGGIRSATTAQEARAAASSLLGTRLVTAQTSAEGLPVSAVLLTERLEAATELYLALTLDRFRATPMLLASRQGGVEIEEVASTAPEAIHREPFDVRTGPADAQAQAVASALGLTDALAPAGRRLVKSLWTLYEQSDASLIEINPLILTADGWLVALDAKVVLDDNALFRHPDLARLRDPSQEPPIEYQASQLGLSYVGLSGTIGCLVNGAGLAMATNDIITLHGGEPANFLDVGGGANVEQVTNAFRIILADARVRAILVNIFGGIMRCDWVAQGLLNASEKLAVKVPLVVRLQGTNVEEGRRLLSQARGLRVVSVESLDDAAARAVALAKGWTTTP